MSKLVEVLWRAAAKTLKAVTIVAVDGDKPVEVC